MERRKNVRYQLSANAVFTWKGAGRASLRAEGLTRDIGPLGAFITCSSCPPVATAVQVDIFIFLSGSQSAVPSLRIRAEAEVVRIDYTETHAISGFCVSCARFRFWPRRGNDRVPAFSSWSDALSNGSLGNGPKLARPVLSMTGENSAVPVGVMPSAPVRGPKSQ